MVETTTVESEDEFVSSLSPIEDNPLSDEQIGELWSLWQQRVDMFGPCKLILLPGWFASEELGARRPFLFAQVEYDDPDSGAVLFSDMHEIDISIVENMVVDKLDYDQTVTMVDISGEDDYIDEAGKMWVPRSLMTVFDLPNETDGAFDGGSVQDENMDPSSSNITDGVLSK